MEDRIFLQSRTGDMAQFCGARRSVLAEGRAAGVETVDVWNYAGPSAYIREEVWILDGLPIGGFRYLIWRSRGWRLQGITKAAA